MLKEKIIHNIKTIRESKNLTADYIAQQMGINQSTYSRKENGESDFSLPELIRIGDVLEVPLVKIIDLDLARIINQSEFRDNSTGIGVIEHQTVTPDEGLKMLITELQKQVEYLKEQNRDLLAAVTGKK
jgi:transcriptional regulator with XRE-family HTH domain